MAVSGDMKNGSSVGFAPGERKVDASDRHLRSYHKRDADGPRFAAPWGFVIYIVAFFLAFFELNSDI